MREILKKLIFFLLVIVAAAFSVTAQASQSIVNRASPVIIGVPLPLSGSLKAFGIMMKNSFEMARESVNENGGIKGRPLKTVYADDQGKASLGGKIIKSLVNDSRAVMLTGGYASNPTYNMAKTAERMDVPFLICTASADKITQKGWKNIYRLNPPISEYTKGLEDFLIKSYKPKSMAVIYENSMFGTGGAMRMMEFCRDNAIEVVSLIPYDKAKASQAYFRPLIAPLTAEFPDVIYMISYLHDAVTLVREIRDLKIKSLLCGGAGGFTLEEFITNAGAAANHLLTATLWSGHLTYPGARQYYDQYKGRYASPPDYHGAEAYSALLVAADALKRAESLDPKSIRTALNETFMITPFGPIKFHSYYDFERQNSTRTQVLQVIDRKFETIWPLEFATKKFVPSIK
ncbi:ABC transporter substrate-binding protein [Thermodesulfobacteriota bacterium]